MGQTCQVDPLGTVRRQLPEKLVRKRRWQPGLVGQNGAGRIDHKRELGVSDRECVQQITENPYLMYFCGFKAFIEEPPFDPSMMVHFRKRFPADVLAQVNNAIAKKVAKKKKPPIGPNEPPTSKPGKMDKKADNSANNQPPENKGKLLVDAICAPAVITFPTDIKLLNKAREKSELIIDILHKVRGRG